MTNWKLFLAFCHLQNIKSWLHHLKASSVFRIFIYTHIDIIIRLCDLFSTFNTFLANTVSAFCWNNYNYQKCQIGYSHSLSLAAPTTLCKGKACCGSLLVLKLLKNKKKKNPLIGLFKHFHCKCFLLDERLKLNELLVGNFLSEICRTT